MSTSQANMVRNALRYDVPSGPGALYSGSSGRRHLLGQMQGRQAAFRLDLDGDGLRDIVIYTHSVTNNVGEFKALLSTRNYSTATGDVMAMSLGYSGETPIIIDYNGDGREDFATFNAADGTLATDVSVISACITPAIPSSGAIPGCNPTSDMDYSLQRGDLPIQGETIFAGSIYSRYMVYRPSTCQWIVRWSNKTSSTYTHNGTCDPTAVPQAGLYDWDTKPDFVTYSPKTGTFRMLTSATSWATSSEITRTFPIGFTAAANSGTPVQRASSIPIWGMYRVFPNYQLGANGPLSNRLGLSLWNPESGEWGILWDPISSSTLDFDCTLGGGVSQLPLPSLFTNLTSPTSGGDSRPGVFTPQGTDVDSQINGRLKWWNSSVYNTACRGVSTTTTNLPSAIYGRGNVAVVSDMTGDGKTDILYHIPDSGRILRVSSGSNYTTSVTYSFGDARAQLLLAKGSSMNSSKTHLISFLTAACSLYLACGGDSEPFALSTTSPPGAGASGIAGISSPSTAGTSLSGSGAGLGGMLAGAGGSKGGGPAGGTAGAFGATGGAPVAGTAGSQQGGAGTQQGGAGTQQGGAGQETSGTGGLAGSSGAGAAVTAECPTALPGPALVRVATPQGKPYCIDQTEVTQGQYKKFLDAKNGDLSGQDGFCKNNSYFLFVGDDFGICKYEDWTPEKTPNRAVVCVDPCDAIAYCQWSGKRLCGDVKGGPIALDKEAVESENEAALASLRDAGTSQFYNACSQGGKTPYPYGSIKQPGVCPVGAVDQDVNNSTCRGSDPPFDQVINLAGGVGELEWVKPMMVWDSFLVRGHSNYGGDWASKNERCDGIGFMTPNNYVGFRCCLDLE